MLHSFFFKHAATPDLYTFPYTTLFRSVPRRSRRLRPVLGRRGAARLGRRAQHREVRERDRKSTRLNSSHTVISYAVFCVKKTTRTGQVQTAGGIQESGPNMYTGVSDAT